MTNEIALLAKIVSVDQDSVQLPVVKSLPEGHPTPRLTPELSVRILTSWEWNGDVWAYLWDHDIRHRRIGHGWPKIGYKERNLKDNIRSITNLEILASHDSCDRWAKDCGLHFDANVSTSGHTTSQGGVVVVGGAVNSAAAWMLGRLNRTNQSRCPKKRPEPSLQPRLHFQKPGVFY